VFCSVNMLGDASSPDTVPWQDLRYIFGEIMYGGHITDFWDRRTNATYLEVLFTEKAVFQSDELAPGFRAPPPLEMNYASYADLIESSLSSDAPPSVVGLHANAEIDYLTTSTNNIFEDLIRLRHGAGSGAGTGNGADKSVREVVEEISRRIPRQFPLDTLRKTAEPLLGKDVAPYVLVAMQECARMNILLKHMRKTLDDLEKGLNGQLNMSQAMEDLASALTLNQVPGRSPFHQCSWEVHAWPSIKPFAPWFEDLCDRVIELNNWAAEFEPPVSVWISMLFNPTAFLTAVMQVTARRDAIALDNMTVETHVTTYRKLQDLPSERPNQGFLVHGLFMQGARWSDAEECEDDTFDVDGVPCAGCVMESRLKELLPQLPFVYVKAVPVQASWVPTSVGFIRDDEGTYTAPVYTTTTRGPTYVFLATLRSKVPTSGWVLGGVAVVMQSNE